MGLRGRVRRLEERIGGVAPPTPLTPTTLDEIRAIEKEIAAIEAEMRAAGMSEAEIRASYEDISPGEELEALEREIERIKAREWSVGLEDRLRKLECAARPEPEDEREREEQRKMVREGAEQINNRRRRNGEEPIFEMTEAGDVFCIRDGKPGIEFHQSLAEEWYWDNLELGNPGGLIHDEESEGFYMPNGELAFSRTRCYLPRFFHALGDSHANP